MRENLPNVILSVPHAHCTFKSRFYRDCDLLALPFANKLMEKLEERCVQVNLIDSKQARAEVDANRFEGRKTAFRVELDALMDRSHPSTVLIDVHSAPDDTLTDSFDIYVLDMYNDNRDDDFNHSMMDYLVSNGVKSFHLDGARKNDIIYRALNDFGLKNVSLVEINESATEKRMEEIATLIADFIVVSACSR